MIPNKIPNDQYTREADYVKHYDGDSITVNIRLWKGLMFEQQSRLLGIDTPELRAKSNLEKEAAKAVVDFVQYWLDYAYLSSESAPLIVRSVKMSRRRAELADYGKYGRLLLRMWRKNDGAELGADLLASNMARPYWGGKRHPWTIPQLEGMLL